MNPISRWLERKRVEREIAAEMAAHIDERTGAPGFEDRPEHRFKVRVIQYFLSGDKNGIDYFPVGISVHTVGISGPYCAKRRKKLSVFH